jgi:type VI secretion system protein ImpH
MATEGRMEVAALTHAAPAAAYSPPFDERANAELEQFVFANGESIEFFQLVRLLHRLYPERKGVAELARPEQEVARFAGSSSLGFPRSEVARLDPPTGDQPAKVVVNFLGLTGPQGVLPLEYSCLVDDRVRHGDTGLRDFLDIFNHRMLSLFYRAWEKSHFFAAQERGGDDRLSEYLGALCGLGPPETRAALPPEHESMLFYIGLLGPQQRSATALEQLIGDYFDVGVTVEQFTGGWYALDAETQCAVGDERGASEQLGLGIVIGDAVYDPQAAARIRLGPLSRERYDEFLPGGNARRELRDVVRLFIGDSLDFELQLILNADEVPPCRIGDPAAPLALGWYTWLDTKSRRASDPDDTVHPL